MPDDTSPEALLRRIQSLPKAGGDEAAPSGADDLWKRIQSTKEPEPSLGEKVASRASALWEGLKRGGREALEGGAQIGARMQAAGPEEGAGAFDVPEQRAAMPGRVDEAVKQSAKAYEEDPARKAHPYFAEAGRIGGNIAATAPLAVMPGLGGAATVAGRLGQGALLGGAAGALQPVVPPGGPQPGQAPGQPGMPGAPPAIPGQSFALEKAKQIGFGMLGGVAGAGLGEVVGSTLGRAIAGNDPAAVERAMLKTYRHVVKPSRAGQTTDPQLAAQDRRIVSAVDDIIAEKPYLTLTNPAGNQVTGQLPNSLRGFSEAIDQTKRTLFRSYDQMAQQAGAAGARVDLAPTVMQLRSAAARPEVAHLHPSVATELERLAATFEQRGSYSAEEAQDVIQNLNRTLASFYKNPTSEVIANATGLGNITPTLRASLDQAIEMFQGPGYQALKNRYGALRSIEKDVAASVQREANKIPGGIGGIFADLASSEEAIRGMLTLNAGAIVRAGGIKMAQAWQRYINNPNRAIASLFAKRESSQTPRSPALQAIGQGTRTGAPIAGALGGGAGGAAATRPDRLYIAPPSEKPRSEESLDRARLKASGKVGELKNQRWLAMKRGNFEDVEKYGTQLAEAHRDYRDLGGTA